MAAMVENADHLLSLPFFRLELPRFLEFALSIPGTWFGIPCTAQTIVPLLCAGLAEGGDARLLLAVSRLKRLSFRIHLHCEA